MNRIAATTRVGDAGDAVANLHEALLFIVRTKPLRPSGLDADQWKAELATEIAARQFGTRTTKLLNGIEIAFGLPVGEIVDERTADALNRVLDELGAFRQPPEPHDPPPPPPEFQYLVRG